MNWSYKDLQDKDTTFKVIEETRKKEKQWQMLEGVLFWVMGSEERQLPVSLQGKKFYQGRKDTWRTVGVVKLYLSEMRQGAERFLQPSQDVEEGGVSFREESEWQDGAVVNSDR